MERKEVLLAKSKLEALDKQLEYAEEHHWSTYTVLRVWCGWMERVESGVQYRAV